VTNVYNKTVIVNNTTTTSFNGEGGVKAQPTPQEQAAANEPHTAPLAAQTQHEQMASQNKQNFASENHGRPAIAATSKPGDFSPKSAVPARAAGAEYHAPAISPKEARVNTPANGNGGKQIGGASPQAKGTANGGYRPFTPPNNSANGSQNKGTSNPSSESKPAMSQPNPPHNNNNTASKPVPQHKSPPPPKASKPPKPEHNKGKGR